MFLYGCSVALPPPNAPPRFAATKGAPKRSPRVLVHAYPSIEASEQDEDAWSLAGYERGLNLIFRRGKSANRITEDESMGGALATK